MSTASIDRNPVAGDGPTTKRCRICCQVRPIGDFRRLRTGSELRRGECRFCRAARKREARLKRRFGATDAYAQRVNRLARRERFVAMATVTGEMIARFGGLDRFVATWKDAVDLAAREGKHYLVSRSLVAVLNLTVASTRIDEAQNQTTDVDDEDLERQFDQAVLRIVAGHPELALRAAQQLGWTLIPPERAGH